LTVAAATKEQFQLLKDLLLSDNYDFWTNPKLGGYTDIMVSPEMISTFKSTVEEAGMKWTVKITNVEEKVQEERSENERIRSAGDGRMAWNAYQRFSVIEPWIQSLDAYAVATVSVIGQTYENRNIYMVKVSIGTLPGGVNKPVVFIDSNIHAREWIAGATGTWILNELVTNPAAYTEILNEVDFYIVPMLNVDGYEYTYTDRMWRKTRSVNAGSSCRGCDPNRNFAFMFGGESTSSNPCSDIYKGEFAFSESETAAVRDAISSIREEAEIGAYITIHSYGQYWLLSWGYTQGVYPPDYYTDLLPWGQRSIAALRAVHGTAFTTGQGADQLYGVGGASDDYAKYIGIKFSTTAELRDRGSYGFILPASQIIPAAQETFAAVLETARTVANFAKK